jgi:predicted CoA-binding protein
LSQKTINEILSRYKTVAVVGLSREPEKESYMVASYLKEHGFHIVPVNPFAEEILGEKSYKSLLDLPAEIQKQIEVVDIFRRPEDVPPIVEQAVKLKKENAKPCVVWMQVGIVNEKAADAARKAGLAVVMDKCMMLEHRRLSQPRHSSSG